MVIELVRGRICGSSGGGGNVSGGSYGGAEGEVKLGGVGGHGEGKPGPLALSAWSDSMTSHSRRSTSA